MRTFTERETRQSLSKTSSMNAHLFELFLYLKTNTRRRQLLTARVCVNPALVFYIWALTWNRNNNESTNGHDKIYSFIFTFIIIILAWNSNDEISIKMKHIYFFSLCWSFTSEKHSASFLLLDCNHISQSASAHLAKLTAHASVDASKFALYSWSWLPNIQVRKIF
jgi:hypothetical protein